MMQRQAAHMHKMGYSRNMLLLYNPENQISPIAARYLAIPFHPIQPKIAHMWANRDRNALWWRVNTSQLQPFKRVVRSWCARRARIAFQEALQKRGLDALGRPLPSKASKQAQALTGSLEICLHQDTRDCSFSSLQNDVLRSLDKVLKNQASNDSDPSQKHRSRSSRRKT